MSRNYEVESGVTVHTASIRDLNISTADKDDSGYLMTGGSNRSLKTAITTEGNILIYMHTNGGNSCVPEDLDDAHDWCEDMGDAPDALSVRCETGARRLLDAVKTLGNEYEDTDDEAHEDLDWYRNIADNVLASLSLPDTGGN